MTEFVEGEKYDYAKWVGLTEDARGKICSKIAEQYRLLRSLPGEGYYGRVHNQSWRYNLNGLRTRTTDPHGPYRSYNDFVSSMLSAAEHIAAIVPHTEFWDPDESACLSEFRHFLATSLRGHEPKFTHIDPGLHNILIRKVVQDNGVEDWEVTLIDWADSGWFPAWMQSVSFDEKTYMRTNDKEGGCAAKKDFVEKVLQGLGDKYSEYIEVFQKARSVLEYDIL